MTRLHFSVLSALGAGAIGLSVVSTGALTSPVQSTAQRTMFRGGPDHLGSYAATTGNDLQGLQWRFDTDGGVVSTPAVLGDTVWVGSGSGKVFAIDRLSGAARWTADLASPVTSSPAVVAGRVIVGTVDGRFHSLRSSTGAVQWQVSTGADLPWPWGHESGDIWTSSAAIIEDLAIVGSGDGFVYALDLATGKTRWKSATTGRIRATPAVSGGRVFVGSADGVFYAFDLRTGKEQWKYATLGATLKSGNFGYDRRTIQSSAVVSGNVVVFGARDGFMYAVSADRGELKWKQDHEISWVNSSPAISDGMVFDGTSDGRFIQAVDLATGAEKWRSPIEGTAWSSPAVSGNLVLSGEGSGRILALDRTTGKLVWAFTTGAAVHSSPVPNGDLVIVGSGDGGVYAVRTGSTPVHRVVLIDSTAGKLKPVGSEVTVAQTLVKRGYQALGSDGLVEFFRARIADRAPSVVVFSMEHMPPAAVTEPFEQSPLRRYLAAGGKVVWRAMPPLLYPRSIETGERAEGGLGAFQWGVPDRLLGIDLARGIFDGRFNRPTDLGRRWGLAQRYRDSWGIDPKAVTEVLALDDWGLAGSWVKSFGGPRGTGFVRAPAEDVQAIYSLAEYRPR